MNIRRASKGSPLTWSPSTGLGGRLRPDSPVAFTGMRTLAPITSLAQHVGQQIFEFPWLAQGDNGVVLHGVSLLREMWSASSPPRYAASSQTAVTNFAAYLHRERKRCQ
jgi:hypothetical protein